MSTEAGKLNMAMQLTGVEAKWLQPFAVTDPFNDDLRLSGYLCQKPDYRYGALALLEVDGTRVPQLVLATPKLQRIGKTNGIFAPAPRARAPWRSPALPASGQAAPGGARAP